jgi:lipopolysaccharide/colanic/teichoic acid biosynthesis glycosyltransferase
MAEMVTAEGAGVVVPPRDPLAFANALTRMADARAATAEMGWRGRNFAEREFLRTTLAQRCVTAMESAAATRSDREMTAYRRWGKRALDLLALLAVLPFVLPVVILVAVVVRFQMGSPVFFRQVRPGYKAKPFTLLKFRTMNSARDERGNLLSDEKRLTKLGTLLRRYSLDEIPQLWNVLKGEMSLVGPRPLLLEYLDRYTSEQARRHEVKPGITGWAQINGRNALSWEERFRLDIWYVEHRSLGLDARIIWRTVRNVLKQKDISQRGHATMPEFMGNDQLES